MSAEYIVGEGSPIVKIFSEKKDYGEIDTITNQYHPPTLTEDIRKAVEGGAVASAFVYVVVRHHCAVPVEKFD